MSSGGSAPPAPDYASAAKETAAGNLEAARFATEANRVDQFNPWGSLTWEKETTPSYDMTAYDAAREKYNTDLAAYNERVAGGDNGWGGYFQSGQSVQPIAPDLEQYKTATTDHWTQTQTLTPDSQAALDSQLQLINRKSTLANDLFSRVSDANATTFDPSNATSIKQPTNTAQFDSSLITARNPDDAPQFDSSYMPTVSAVSSVPVWDHAAALQAQKAAYDSGASLLNPQFTQATSALDNKLALQGLAPTSESYQTSMGNNLREQNNAYTNLANQSVLTGNQTGLNMYNAALAGTQAQQSIYNQQLQNGLAAYQARISGNQQQQNLVNQQTQNAMAKYSTQRAGVMDQQSLYNTQLGNALAQYNLPLNQVNALLSGTQISAPSFGSYALQSTTQGADLLGAAQSQYTADLNAANASNASDAQFTNGLMGLATLGVGAFTGGAGLAAMGGLSAALAKK